MRNTTWRDTTLQVTDLPAKAQRFIDLMEIDIRGTRLMLLESDPNGKYFKYFDENGLQGQYNRLEEKIYFIERIKTGVTIHELTHFYLDISNHDTKAIAEAFGKDKTKDDLSNYGFINYLKENWDEVVCEIVAVYGRRGQFDKIRELFNQAAGSNQPR